MTTDRLWLLADRWHDNQVVQAFFANVGAHLRVSPSARVSIDCARTHRSIRRITIRRHSEKSLKPNASTHITGDKCLETAVWISVWSPTSRAKILSQRLFANFSAKIDLFSYRQQIFLTRIHCILYRGPNYCISPNIYSSSKNRYS